jgi:hypothetical protein
MIRYQRWGKGRGDEEQGSRGAGEQGEQGEIGDKGVKINLDTYAPL